ncbi:MAG: hypothetical protein V2A74_06945, partial [bacterium]
HGESKQPDEDGILAPLERMQPARRLRSHPRSPVQIDRLIIEKGRNLQCQQSAGEIEKNDDAQPDALAARQRPETFPQETLPVALFNQIRIASASSPWLIVELVK